MQAAPRLISPSSNTQPQVEPRDMAAVLFNGKATLKRVIQEQDRVRLRPENDHYQEIVITSKSTRNNHIDGRLVELIRQGSL